MASNEQPALNDNCNGERAMSKLNNEDYRKAITARITDKEAFKCVANAAGWWI
jgi:hypothetical protein